MPIKTVHIACFFVIFSLLLIFFADMSFFLLSLSRKILAIEIAGEYSAHAGVGCFSGAVF